MADEEDPSQLFAIPDLWRPSSWLNQTFTEANKGTATPNPLFTLNSTPIAAKANFGESHGLLTFTDIKAPDRPPDDGDGNEFFKLPSLLRELASQTEIEPVDIEARPFVDDDQQRPVSAAEVSLCSSDGIVDGENDDVDFWLFSEIESTKPGPQLCTWEAFEQPDQDHRSVPLFLSEAGPTAFDALLATNQAASGEPDILSSALYCTCLLNLALGRSSLLYSWDADKNSFVKTSPGLRISGLSLDLVGAVDTLCLSCGNSARHLQAFAEKTYSAAATPTRVALARAVARLVDAVRSELSTRGRHVQSLLQLQSIVQPVQSILSYFRGFVKRLSQQKSDETLLSCLFQEAEASEYRSEIIKECTREVLRILSRPWIDSVEEWIGLKPEEGFALDKKGPGKGFVRVADKVWIDDQGFELEEADYFLDEDKLPVFISEDMGQAIFETGRNLRFLREHHPEHALSRPDVVTRAGPPKLEWEFEWEAISKLEAKANQYQEELARAIEGLSSTSVRAKATPALAPKKRKYSAAGLECFGKDEAQVEARLLASIDQLNRPLEDPAPQDELTRLLKSHLYRTEDLHQESTSLSPHWTLVPFLSFGPVIEAQSRLISRECMRLLFSAHHLRTHIDLLRQYFLLGNGLFCSRLAHALFDPDLSSAERRSGVALGGSGAMGLRLAGRRTWPPASSELRLALMGVLSECYQPPPSTSSSSVRVATADGGPPLRAGHTRTSSSHPDLPGDLSFAVRDLIPEEIDRCIDPDSLEALDFLRLSYRPPAALRAVLAPSTLLRYDRVFRLLLRILRMLYVADELLVRRHSTAGGEGESNASMRLRIEARHFVKQVAAHFFEAGIAAPWRRFEEWLEQVQEEVAASREDGGSHHSPDSVRERQERALDEMMSVLLLRKRQAPVMTLLEDIFGVVLRFAKGLRLRSVEGGETPEELYRTFRKKVDVFVTVCKGLGEKMAASSSASASLESDRGGSCVEQLLVRLDMVGFYGKVTMI
ncbi:hypothetical protein VTJ49DRAFT_5636 [Mycothermus thermophilus]|uniref:Spindle pole body component n=1 Tax=Humicola insolens TaxID=85995 RepID=A0ABR3V2P0_HUMIN